MKLFRSPIRLILSLLLLMVFVLVGGVVWVSAATGLVSVPVISAWAFHEPVPVHVVQPGLPLPAFMAKEMAGTVISRLQTGRGQLLDRSIHLTIPEATLTATLQEKLQEIHDPRVLFDKAQLVVLPNHLLDIFIPLQMKERITALHFTMIIGIDEQGGMTGIAKDVWFGSWHLPSFFTEIFSRRLLQTAILQTNTKSATVVSFTDFSTEPGELLVTGTLAIKPSLLPFLK